jgi:hypothetical protein
MKIKLLICALAGALAMGLAINSCKKSTDYLPTLLTAGPWQLASLQVKYFTGAFQDSLITLDTTCNLTQIFRFSNNGTCTYSNFSCRSDTSSGHWSFSSDHLYLNSDMACQTDTGKIVPFKSAHINNLGQYSLVLQTGDLDAYYSPSQKRRIYIWGFVRVKTQ